MDKSAWEYLFVPKRDGPILCQEYIIRKGKLLIYQHPFISSNVLWPLILGVVSQTLPQHTHTHTCAHTFGIYFQSLDLSTNLDPWDSVRTIVSDLPFGSFSS